MINELYSKRPANLDEIVDGDSNPSKDEILNSKDFQINLINDLISNKKNVDSWTVRQSDGSIDDLENHEDEEFNLDYEFDFIYKFHDIKVPLTLFINGVVDVNWSTKPEIDEKSLGKQLDLALYDDDASEISLKWLTPELKSKVVKSIISPYL